MLERTRVDHALRCPGVPSRAVSFSRTSMVERLSRQCQRLHFARRQGRWPVVRTGRAEAAGARARARRGAILWATKPGAVVFSGINCRGASFKAMPAFALRKKAVTLARGKDWTSGGCWSSRERTTRCDPLGYQGGLGWFLERRLSRGFFRGNASVCVPENAGTLAHGEDWISGACKRPRDSATRCGSLEYEAGRSCFLRHQLSRGPF
jgi:hypothetical protein